MAKSGFVKNVADLLIEVARISRSVAGARTNWSVESARGDACVIVGAIRIAKKKTGRQVLFGVA
jgi:hypothetical protein